MSKTRFEKEILKDSENIKIPEELNKEKMMAAFEEAKKTDNSVNEGAIADRYIDIGKKQIRRFHKNVFKAVSLAACFMACAVAINHNQVKKVSKPVEGDSADNYLQIYNKLCEIKEEYYENNYLEGGFWSNLIKGNSNRRYYDFAENNEVIMNEGLATEDASLSKSEGSTEHSNTNVRTENVDEGDFVKTDGDYIYILEPYKDYSSLYYTNEVDGGAVIEEEAAEKSVNPVKRELVAETETETETEIETETETEIETETETETEIETETETETETEEKESKKERHYPKDDYIKIVKAAGSETKVVSEFNISKILPKNASNHTFKEMYVDGDNLFVVCDVEFKNTSVSSSNDLYEYLKAYHETYVYTIDISDKEDPELDAEVNQEGVFMTSRLVGGYIYTFTYKTLYDFTEERCVPKINGNYVQPQNVYISEYVDNTSYVVISSIDIDKPGKIKKSVALLADYADFYVSTNNMYVIENSYEEETKGSKLVSFKKTHLTKVNYSKGKIKVIAEKSYRGTIKNSDCIDEYDGNIRMVLSYDDFVSTKDVTEDVYSYLNNEKDNVLVIVNDKLDIVSKLTGIAPDEQVKSVRFMGDVGYVVTFRNTDPLFAFDISNPKKPKLLGCLEIPGYSDYLYSWDDDHLIGIGTDWDEEGRTCGKISMFDVSDPLNLKEVHKYMITGCERSNYLTAYKCLLLDKDKNLIGIPSRRSGFGEQGIYKTKDMYSFYKYDDTNGFTVLKDVDYTKSYEDRTEKINDENVITMLPLDNIMINNIRGLYCGGEAYVVAPSIGIMVFDLNNFECVADISTYYYTDEELESIQQMETETETEFETETETESESKKKHKKKHENETEETIETIETERIEEE